MTVEIITQNNVVEIVLTSENVIEIAHVGAQGIQGLQGATGAQGAQGDQNVYIQDTDPAVTGAYLWIDTSGSNISFWVNEG